jgi:hypothetical protein
MKVTRNEVYAAVDSERNYQENLPRSTEKVQAPLEHLTIIRRIVRDMEDSWYDNPGKADMNFMRKIAAVAVRAMEQHGAPLRGYSGMAYMDGGL